MACNCIRKAEESILAMLQERYPEKGYSDGKFINQAYMFTPGRYELHNIYEASYPAKNGKTKEEKINFTMEFCPMCGKSMRDAKEETEVKDGM